MISVFSTGWFSIAKGEYRVATSRFREIRSYFPYLLLGGMGFYVFVLAPMIVSSFVNDFQALLLSYVAAAIAQVLLLMLFIIFMSLPIASTLQDISTSQIEILMAAPIRPGSILLGEFIGKIPIYSIFGTIFGGLLTAAMFPLGLDVFQISVVLIIFIAIFLLASWLGTLIAVIARSKLIKSARGRDIGKGLAFIVILPVMAMIYAVIGGYLDFLSDPSNARVVQDILGLLPSSWGADVIVDFAVNPGNILNTSSDSIIKFFSLIALFMITLWAGGKIANRVYNLEPSSFSATKTGSDGLFYNSIKTIGGRGSSGILLSSSFKNYFRRFKNLTQLTYAVGLIVVMNVFLMKPDDSEGAFIGTIILGGLLGMFVISELTIHGKERLLLYKQTPTTTWGFIRIKLYHYLLIILSIIVTIETALTVMVPGITIDYLVLNLGMSILIAFSLTLIGMGIYLLNPAFHEKAGEFMINSQVLIFATMIPFFVILITSGLPFYEAVTLYGVIVFLAGLILLYLGVRKLDNLE